ncbi:MAG: winged helix-turn-helix transcriptional regulator [Candidatus Altiarchaeota archaeon]|nr:winged helix-turn-helix transcriptional regulator [Candidatus Altiarchaeota archaeon]MBU4341872.1 winged helix-turn-helix transcriptional regulator [Candidatus Altiarchaeota archaeon]MBU4406821.1 winged helix-turn-helix transcriptional regulator [Candidatus Altiarchaeota archaeon]MBU4436983.1 winged helix-turn-helix transcriptional regulator [Candidatus Altiarchaeota archaeon]
MSRVIYLNKSITQKDLMDKTGIYKMKISRMLWKFEQRGIIGKKPHGYTNLIMSKI